MNNNESEPAVIVRDLEKRFGKFVAVNRVSFEVSRGEIFGFLGSNGAGKSTVIRMLVGLLSPTSGSGTVAGFDVRTEAEKIKKHIGYMSQKFSLYDDLTVEENINFYSGIYLKGVGLEILGLDAVLLSGFMFPINNMPTVIQWFTYLNPLRYFLVIIRGVFLKGVGLEILWPQMAALAIMGVVTLWMAASRFQKTLA